MTAALVGDDVARFAAALADAQKRLGEAIDEDAAALTRVIAGGASALARAVAELDPDIVERTAEFHDDLFRLKKALPAFTPTDVREALADAEHDAEFVRRYVDPDWTGPECILDRRLGPRRHVGVGRRTRTRRSRRRAAQGRRGPPGDPERPRPRGERSDVAGRGAAA